MGKKITTVPSFTMEETTNPNVMRFVDRHGDWTHYFLVKEQKFVKAVNHVLSLGYSKGPQFRAYLESHTKEEIAKTLNERGDEGSRTHMAIRDLIKGLKITMSTKYPTELRGGRMEALNDDEWENVQAWIEWCERYQPRRIAFEDTIACIDFAGTLDGLFVITVPSGDKVFEKPFWGKDVLLLPDWKSSSAIWSEYEAQTAAYWSMVKHDPRFEKFVKTYAGRIFTGVVRLGTLHASGWQFEVWDQKYTEGEHMRRFEAARVIADRHEPEFNPKVEEIPTQFFIKIPKAKVAPIKTTKKLPI